MISKKIDYFLTLAECLSFTQTAAKHEVSQTAISQYIASLEERLGVQLFNRSQRFVALTEAGKYYYQQVKSIQRQYEETLHQLHTIASGYHGSLKVGVGMYEYCSTEGFFSDFLTAHPEVRVDILQFPYSTLTEKLRTGELDIIIADALCEDAFSRRELLCRTLMESPNDLVAAPQIAERYADATEMLRHECLITNCEGSGPSSIDMLRRLLTDQFGFVPETIAQTNSVNAQLMMVRAGHGVALVPGFVVDAQGGSLARFSLPEKRSIRYELICLAEHANPAIDMMFGFNAAE